MKKFFKPFTMIFAMFIVCITGVLLVACNPSPTKITLDESGVTKEFEVGDEFNVSGIIAYLVYDDESKEVVTEFEAVAKLDSLEIHLGEPFQTAGQYTVVINYEEFSAEYTISVGEHELETPTPEKFLQDHSLSFKNGVVYNGPMGNVKATVTYCKDKNDNFIAKIVTDSNFYYKDGWLYDENKHLKYDMGVSQPEAPISKIDLHSVFEKFDDFVENIDSEIIEKFVLTEKDQTVTLKAQYKNEIGEIKIEIVFVDDELSTASTSLTSLELEEEITWAAYNDELNFNIDEKEYIDFSTLPAVNVASDFNANLSDAMEILQTEVYNNLPEQKTYTSLQVKELFDNFDFYVSIASVKNIDIQNLKLGNTSFENGDEVTVSVGNNSFIKDVAWFVDNGSLKVAIPVAAIELGIDNHVILNNDQEFAFSVAHENLQVSKVENITFENQANLVDGDAENGWTISISDTESMMKLSTDISESENVVTKLERRLINGQKLMQYGVTDLLGNGEVGLYPVGWNTSLQNLYNTYDNMQCHYIIMGSDKLFETDFTVKAKVTEVSDEDELRDAATKGGIVKLSSPRIRLSESLIVNSKMLLDLNGNMISAEDLFIEDDMAAIWVKSGKLTIVDSAEFGGIESNVYGIMVGSADEDCHGEVEIYNGLFTAETKFIYLLKGTASIYGGEFDVFDYEFEKKFMLDMSEGVEGDSNIFVYGGLFRGFDPTNVELNGQTHSYVPENYVVSSTYDEDYGEGVWTVTQSGE